MEFVAVLFDHLDNECRPFPKRFKLAQNAYYATGGSSERIISWICTNLKSMADSDFSQFLTEWDRLVRSVHTQHVQLLVNVMCESVIDRLKDYNRCIEENTFLYIVEILENSRVQSYFFTDLDSYISLVEALLSALGAGSKTDNYVCERLFQLMEAFARMMSLREFPALFIDRLLLPSVHLVNTVDSQNSLKQHMISCVEKAVFYKNTPLMTTFLDSLFKTKKIKPEQSKEVLNNAQKLQPYSKAGYKLLDKLNHVLDNADPKDALLTFTTIFKCLLKTNSPNVICLKLLIATCPILGIHVNNAKLKVELPEEVVSCRTSPNELSFLVFESILLIILKEGIALPNDDEFQCVNWIECLWRTLLSLPLKLRQSGEYLRTLSTLLQLHPRVVLNRKLTILTDLLVALTPDKEIPDFVTFLHVLLSIHQKRFTVHELLTSLFTNSKQLLNTRKRVNSGRLSVHCVVPPSVFSDIQKYAADWPSAPVLDFINFMLTQLQTLAFTSDNLRSVYTESATAIGVRLLSGILTGARIVDHCGNEKIRLLYVARLKSMCQLQKQMASVAQTSQDEVSTQAFLELAYAWAAVVTMLQHYCPDAVDAIYDSTESPDEQQESLTSTQALIYVHRHITADVWESIKTKVTSSDDLVSQSLLVRLETQSLRYFFIKNPTSRLESTNIAKSILPLLVSYVDMESMINDVCYVGNLLETQDVRILTDKIVDILLCSDDRDGIEPSKKNYKPLQYSKSVTCGVVHSMMDRLYSVCSENHCPIARKILSKLANTRLRETSTYAGEVWEEVLSSVSKCLNKALKKTEGVPEHNLAELSQIKEILRVFSLQPLGFLPESLQTAVIILLLGLSIDLRIDLLSLEESEEKSTIYDLIYHQMIYGILERWSVTTEAPPLQKYLDMALVVSHIQVATKLSSPVDISLVHTLLGLSIKSAKSANRVLNVFFAEGQVSSENFAIRLEMLNIVYKDSLNAESREVLKTTDCVNRVVSSMSSYIHSERPKKHLISVYTLLLCQALKKSEKLEDFVPHLKEYCKLAVKCIRKDGSSRKLGEDFVREILKYHGLQEYLPENFALDVWSALRHVDQPNVDIASLLFSSASKDDFKTMVESIVKELESTADELTANRNILCLFESLVKSALISEKSLEVRQWAVMRFLSFQHVFLVYPPGDLLKVLLSIVETSKLVLNLVTADAIFLAVSWVTSRGSRTDNIELAPVWFSILHGMLFHRASQTLDCLPAFTAELRLLVQTVVHCSRHDQKLPECISVAQGVEKMFQTIVKAKMTKNFIRIGAYILADLLKHFEGRLPQDMKVILENIACEILNFLDAYAQRFLGKVVGAESAEILREIGRIRALRRSKIV